MGALLILGLVLLVLWVLAVVAFKVAAFAIHLLLIVGIILIVAHFVRRGTNAARRRV